MKKTLALPDSRRDVPFRSDAYLFLQATWFGKPLNDKQMADAFNDSQHPRNAQHALSQVADRMESNDPAVRTSAKPWYSQAIAAASSSESALRSTAAW